jgi:ABC-type transport system involved in multi-copper enzyme maturation permease subunit
MKREWLQMKVRVISLFILFTILFFSLAPFQNFTINILNENSEAIKKFVGENFVEKLKNWEYYILSQWFGKNFGQFIPILAIIIAFPLFSREYENETITFLLSRQNRKTIFLQKTLLSIFVLLILITYFSYLPSIYSLITSKELSILTVSKFYIHSLIGSFFWFSIALVFTTYFTNQVKPILSSAVVLGLTTTLGLLKPLKFFNTYKYILGYSIFEKGKVDISYTIALTILSFICIYFSYLIFKEKEV